MALFPIILARYKEKGVSQGSVYVDRLSYTWELAILTATAVCFFSFLKLSQLKPQ